ncbi:Uma2 family endonuclease [Streptomyces sp. NPDC000888]
MGATTSTASGNGSDDEPPYRWPIPPPEGWTADDLNRIPGLPPHTELIDGSVVFVSPRTAFHGRCVRLLENSLLGQAPDHLDVMREMAIKLDTRNRPEPDVLVFPVEANTGPKQTWYKPEDIVLAVEVVSPDSRERDREVKLRKYADAGFPHFWRVEDDDGKGLPVVYVYELDPTTKAYGITGIFRDRLKVTVPFEIEIEIDLTAINQRRGGSAGPRA